MSVIKVENLRKEFGGVVAVDGVDLEVHRGEVMGLLGPSGCGKTTTLRCIAGLETTSGGRVTLAGRVVNDGADQVPPERRALGMVFQSYALWPHMTVEKNITFPLAYSDVPKGEHAQRLKEAVESVGLEGLGPRYPSELSGGQQQRVAVARAIAPQPQILLFDEPLSNLDAKLRNQVRLELKILLRRLDATALYVTHDQKEAMALCDRIAVMCNGVIRQIGTPKEIYEQPIDTFVASFIGETNLIPFEVTDVDGRRVISIAGKQLSAEQNVSTDDMTEGTAVLRPEHIEFADSLQGRFGWEVTIEERLYLGTYTQYLVNIASDGATMMVEVQDPFHDVGDRTFLIPRLDKIVWLPPERATGEVFVHEEAESTLGTDVSAEVAATPGV